MNIKVLKHALFFLVLLAINLSLLCQIEGESEITTIIIKKPGSAKQDNSDSVKSSTRDILPPEIQIISPRIDTSFTATITASDIYLVGRITGGSGVRSLLINDQNIDTDENGFFQQSYQMNDGLNVFKLEVIDNESNTCSKLLSLIKTTQAIRSTSDEVNYDGINYGLIIGINTYNDPAMMDLDNPITDATLLSSTLIGNYMFEPEHITLLKDPTRADIIKKLDELSYRLTKNDNLLIFYAGHGYWDKEKETGFWLPADAEKFSSVNWIRNSTIQDFVDDINTRHTLLITDACFAGSIFKSRGGFQDAPVAVNKLYSLTSRKAMTSGTLKQVPDRSVFLEYMLKRLMENEKKYLSASELFSSFREAVLNNSPNIPQYGVIQDTGDEGGDFIFIKR